MSAPRPLGWWRPLAALIVVVVVAVGGWAVHVTRVPVPATGAPAAVPRPLPHPVPPASAPAATPAAGDLIDPRWLAETADATGIPSRALAAYAAADLMQQREQPECAIGWNTLAAIGSIESDHGRHDGAVVRNDGWTEPRIVGPALDGDGVAAIPDTEQGVWDGDRDWDRAVGPMQFIPDTWSRWGADGDGDGSADPNQIDDAALAAARYLCADSTMATPETWRAAVFSYNNLDSYVDDVAAAAQRYAEAAA